LTLIVRVAVPIPALDLLTYSIPPGVVPPVVGARVVVPVGSRLVTGIAVEIDTHRADGSEEGLDSSEVKAIHQVVDADSFVPADLVALARWTAEYYAAGAGETITAVLPPKTRQGGVSGHKTVRMAAITAAGLEVLQSASVTGGLTAKQLQVLEQLAGVGGGLATAHLGAQGFASETLTRLAARGLVALRRDQVDRDPFEAATLAAEPEDRNRQLTQEQADGLDRLRALADTRAFRVALLHGVTGSGKTELYIRLSAVVRASGRNVLMLVPEIALTPATASLFRQAFGAQVAILHSALSDGERHDEWQRIRRGDACFVVGTRSAVFAPLGDVGLIVVDEEHDASYKQEENPRYNGRDVAIVRAQRENALIVLASATPSMESYHNAMIGRYERVVLQRRVKDRPLPAVSVVDMREEYATTGPDVVLSRAMVEAISARLASQEQALVLLNRRGFATAVFCRQCAGTLECPNCSVSLVVHGEGTARRARCHYCNYSTRVPTACQVCAGPYLEQTGFGTERVEAEIRRLWPAARIARLDRDAIRRKGALAQLLQQFRQGDIDVLVGTQMIAKGHDFPRVTLVGVVSADIGLGLADFRASERTFQLLTQVAGRAGRGEQAGEAIIQTLYPEHYSIQLACRQDFGAFYDRELKFRRAMRYPPAVSLINTVVRSRTFAAAMDDAGDVAQLVRQGGNRDVRVLGPAPAPLTRLRGEYRAQLLIKGTSRKKMREAVVAAVRARPNVARRTTIDVDPLSVL
jgi:primosomal protein N' (replication factor Y) (superfamily II helicase)